MNREEWRASATPARIERLLADLPPGVGSPMGPHLTDDDLFALGRGEADPAGWRRAVDHVATCDECAYEIAMLAEDAGDWAGAGGDHRLRALVARIVGATDELRAAIAEWLGSADPATRGMATILIAGIGAEAATPAILDRIVDLLQDRDQHIIDLARCAVRAMGAAAATPAILARLADEFEERDGRGRGSAGSVIGVTGDVATTLDFRGFATSLPLAAKTVPGATLPVASGVSADGRLRWQIELAAENVRITLVSRDMGLRGRGIRIRYDAWNSDTKVLGLVAKDQVGTSFVLPRESLAAPARGTSVRVEYHDPADLVEGSRIGRPPRDNR